MTLILINLNPYGELTNIFAHVAQTITSTGSATDSGSFERFQIWQTAFKMIYDAPFFGTGLGSYSQNLANEGYATWSINNTC